MILSNRNLANLNVYVAESKSCNLHTKTVIDKLKLLFNKVYTWEDVEDLGEDGIEYPDDAEFCIIIPPTVRINASNRIIDLTIGKGCHDAYCYYGDALILEGYNGDKVYTFAEIDNASKINQGSWKDFAKISLGSRENFSIPDWSNVNSEVPEIPKINLFNNTVDSVPYNPLHLLLKRRKS